MNRPAVSFSYKNSKNTKDSVSKTNKRKFFTFFFKKNSHPKPLPFKASETLSLLKTVFYKKHPIDENNKWSYHYITTYPQSS